MTHVAEVWEPSDVAGVRVQRVLIADDQRTFADLLEHALASPGAARRAQGWSLRPAAASRSWSADEPPTW